MLTKLQVWRDRRGHLSWLRIGTLALLIVPVLIALRDADEIVHGARPINDLIHRTGYWALIFLLLTLAVTPLRRIARFGSLLDVRRMIGVGAFCYALVHILLFTADQMFDLAKVFGEITHRVYLIIGFSALAGLAALAATSTDRMVRRLGGQRWQRLHQLVYAIALLALIHYFQQTKADMSVPTFAAGLFGWLMGYRLILKLRRSRGELSPWTLLTLGVAVSVLTFLGEAIGIGIVFHVSPFRVLETAFNFDPDMIRPGWLVFGSGLCVVVLDIVFVWRSGLRPVTSRAQTDAARAKTAA
jgi:methionine sulfoxide reductase heme-binding subunit